MTAEYAVRTAADAQGELDAFREQVRASIQRGMDDGTICNAGGQEALDELNLSGSHTYRVRMNVTIVREVEDVRNEREARQAARDRVREELGYNLLGLDFVQVEQMERDQVW